MLADVEVVIRQLAAPDARGRILRRGAAYMGKWLLAGIAVSLLTSIGTVLSAGFHGAWEKSGEWWFIAGAIFALLPALFVIWRATLEIVMLLGLFIVVKVAEFIGPIGRRVVRWAFVAAMVAFGAFLIFGLAYQLAAPEVVASPGGVSPPVAAEPSAHQDWAAWWAALGGIAVAALLAVKKVGESLLSEWAKRRFNKPKEQGRTLPLYDPHGRVIRTVALEPAE